MTEPSTPHDSTMDCMAVVRAVRVREWSTDDRRFIGPWPEDLPTWIQHVRPDDGVVGSDATSLFGVLWGSCNELYNQMQPLQTTANALPQIVAHSDEVHTELQQGLNAIRTAVGAVQTAASSLGSSLSSITQVAAQAQASAAVANAAATSAGQRCASLEARCATLETKVANHEGRVAALEARRVQTWRAAGDLPTLAVNATADVTCRWATTPSTLPTIDQCSPVVAGAAATLTVKSVSATGVVVTVKALAALLPTAGALQVVAATW